jgi:hypothetical protein
MARVLAEYNAARTGNTDRDRPERRERLVGKLEHGRRRREPAHDHDDRDRCDIGQMGGDSNHQARTRDGHRATLSRDEDR